MNNKGQTLVIFVIVLPIILIIFTLIIDLGFMHVEKRNIDNNVYTSVEYYLENINEEDVNKKTKNLLQKNINNIDNIIINETDDYIEIGIVKTRKSVYSIILNKEEINIKYKGFKEDKKIIKGW